MIADRIANGIIGNGCTVDLRQQIFPLAITISVGLGNDSVFGFRQNITCGVVGIRVGGGRARRYSQILLIIGIDGFARELVLHIVGI